MFFLLFSSTPILGLKRVNATKTPQADLSLMARTKKQAKAARENLKKNSQACSSLEEEALDLEELLAKSREKAEATKAARDRVARLRRELEEFENGEFNHPDSDPDQDPAVIQPASAPAAPDVATALAATLQSAVNRQLLLNGGFFFVNKDLQVLRFVSFRTSRRG